MLRGKLRFVLLALLAAGLVPTSAIGQTLTQVSATITDPNGLPYSNATVIIQLAGGGSTPQVTPCAVSPCNVTNPPPIQTGPTGAFSIALWANGSITPGSTQWSFLVQEPGVAPPWGYGPKSLTYTATISGATDDLSTAMSALAPALTPAFSGGATPCATTDAIQYYVSPNLSCSSAFTYNPATPLLTRTETGTFTGGSQNYFYNEFLLNACNPATVNAAIGSIISESNYFYTDALSACTESPSGSGTATNDETNGLAGYAINNNSQQQGSFGGPYVVAGTIGSGYCIVSNTECEGAVQFALDTTSLSGVVLVGDEVGMFPQNTSDLAYGFLASAFGSVQPTFDKAPAFYAKLGGIGTFAWTSGFNCQKGAITTENTYYANCLELNPIASGSGEVSQSIAFNATNSGGTAMDAYLLESDDAGSGSAGLPRFVLAGHNGSATADSLTVGALIYGTYSSPVTAVSCGTLSGVSGGVIGHFTAGSVTSCSFTINLPVTTYTEWHCQADDWTTPADHIGQTGSTNTTASMSGTIVSGDVIHYACNGGF